MTPTRQNTSHSEQSLVTGPAQLGFAGIFKLLSLLEALHVTSFLMCRHLTKATAFRGKKNIIVSDRVKSSKVSDRALNISSFREKSCLLFKVNPFCFVSHPVSPKSRPLSCPPLLPLVLASSLSPLPWEHNLPLFLSYY